ncbi:MAG: type II toxin-antitoxin system prevent-host-death family antitoxin [Deltaproteobacteria bacterium]|nr:type II toxin-antitoxin system prevent-host-death family antitoxin [Deltaproteobacteria bacterium]
MRVGTKELKNRLSHYLRSVRDGERLYVTDRGRIVAEIRRVPAATTSEEEALLALAADGLLTIGSGRLEDFEPVRLKGGRRLSQMIIDDRE